MSTKKNRTRGAMGKNQASTFYYLLVWHSVAHRKKACTSVKEKFHSPENCPPTLPFLTSPRQGNGLLPEAWVLRFRNDGAFKRNLIDVFHVTIFNVNFCWFLMSCITFSFVHTWFCTYHACKCARDQCTDGCLAHDFVHVFAKKYLSD